MQANSANLQEVHLAIASAMRPLDIRLSKVYKQIDAIEQKLNLV